MSVALRTNRKIVVAGQLQVDRVDRDRYVADCVAVVQQARTAPGCLDFAITADPVEPHRFNVYERWDSDAHLARFAVRARTPGRPSRSATPRCASTASPPPRTRSRRRFSSGLIHHPAKLGIGRLWCIRLVSTLASSEEPTSVTRATYSSWPDPVVRSDPSEFADDPLDWLLRAGRRGPLAIVSHTGPVLSRADTSSGAVAVFGPAAVRQVLCDIETFGMPVSVSTRHELPPTLANLNSALFSMTGPRHRSRQQLLARLLGPAFAAEQEAAIDRGIRIFIQSQPIGSEIRLMDEMRRLAQLVAEQVLLGTGGSEIEIGPEIQLYFDQRRHYASRDVDRRPEHLDALIEQGTRVDALLRARVRALRHGTTGAGYSVLDHLCRYGDDRELALTEDELVAHANVLFMSSSEPIATGMTWILLELSQRPELRAAIRKELGQHPHTASGLLRGTVHEILRLVPPSAIMVRLTRREVRVAGSLLPPPCEVIVCPFAEHRRPEVFPDPHRLWPERWNDARPDPFQFLPFGSGARFCLGRRIALATLERGTRAILTAADPVLAHPQRLDWRMNVTLLPASDPVLRLAPHSRVPVRGGELSGPAAALLRPTRIS